MSMLSPIFILPIHFCFIMQTRRGGVLRLPLLPIGWLVLHYIDQIYLLSIFVVATGHKGTQSLIS